MKVVIIDYGAGNTQSVKYAFERIGVHAVLSDNADVISAADRVVFPGVGHAKPAMERLSSTGLDKVICNLQQPVLGICLGMQLMCSYSEEGDTTCLGIFDETVKLFEPKLKVPHVGWNTTSNSNGHTEWYYYVHSYYVPESSYTTHRCNYIQAFSAGIKRNNFTGVQFHPEKSGAAGEYLLKQFIAE
jgi:imidazole glycerol-phosphate synthase subunit HisH